MQGQAVAGAPFENLVRHCHAFFASALRVVVAPEAIQRLYHPAAGFCVVGPHVEVTQIARTEIRGDAHGLSFGANGVFVVICIRLLETDADQRLDVGAPCGH